ncbi:MAG: glycosyltransferase family 4 protein [Pyrinomonadaceae bacterium MAG19_C2-C3]|nr:glycosyltransferase family 4 protein [Pyrinomonadaceae bacterium MAG19_C2-C3]
MHIAIINDNRRLVGGVETYLNGVIKALADRNHSLSFFSEISLPVERAEIGLPTNSPVWCVAELGVKRALDSLRAWQPDVIYAHGLGDTELEAETIKIAPSVFFIENYYGTCISGSKTHKHPTARPCHRPFGVGCFAYYYPRRCGGLNPLTMVRSYKEQARRLKLLSEYDVIISTPYMKAEMEKHNFEVKDAYDLRGIDESAPVTVNKFPHLNIGMLARQELGAYVEKKLGDKLNIFFLGRLEFLKGGEYLLGALPLVHEALKKPLRVIFAGDGPARAECERKAIELHKRFPFVEAVFTGWLAGGELEQAWAQTDVMVVPSIWPEPFATVGREAAIRGVPVAAFDVGGNRDWLIDSVNGSLATGDPPTAHGLSKAIISILSDQETNSRLRRGAVTTVGRFTMDNHLDNLLVHFESAIALRERKLESSARFHKLCSRTTEGVT